MYVIQRKFRHFNVLDLFDPNIIKIQVSKGGIINAYWQFAQINTNVVETVPDRRISKCSSKKY